MIKLFIELLVFLRTCAPLLTSLAVLALLCVLLSKSIKRHAVVYYTVFAIPFFLVALPSVGRLFGIETLSFNRIPFLGEVIRDYIHMGTFGHPLLIIIMYIGALNPKSRNVKKLLSIRKELSIISGFAVFAHSLVRVINNLPGSFTFFANHTEYMENTKVVSELGAGISSFSFILGVLMLAIFIPLWITSFDGVRKRMGNVTWKKFQKWSYVLYATLFIHAIGIQTGGMLNPRGGHAPKTATVETVAVQRNTAGGQGADSNAVKQVENSRRNGNREMAGQAGSRQNEQTTSPAGEGRMPAKGFADIEVSAQAKRYIHFFSLILIYGSYLFLRLRKARRYTEYFK